MEASYSNQNSPRGKGGVSFLVGECLVNAVEIINSVKYEESVWMKVHSEKAGADLEHNLGGGQEHARGTGRASGERSGKVSPSPCEAWKL